MVKLIEELRSNAENIHELTSNEKVGTHAITVEKAIELVTKHENVGWISIKEKLPPCETEVQITTRRRDKQRTYYIVTNAFYEDGTMPTEDSDWTWIECDFKTWDEEADCYLIDEGWWEYKHYNPEGEYNNSVDDEVIAWRELPNPYKEV